MEAVYLAMLAMLTHLQDTVFATGPPNLCLQTPGPFSPWQCQSVKTTVRLFSCLPHYFIRSRYVVFVKRRLLSWGNVYFSVNSGGFSAC